MSIALTCGYEDKVGIGTEHQERKIWLTNRCGSDLGARFETSEGDVERRGERED